MRRPLARFAAVLPLLLGAFPLAAQTTADSDRPWETVAPDSAARRLLADVRSADSTIVVDARYAGSSNFTGAPLPGYQANRAFLRREAVSALVRVQARLRTGGIGLKVFDGYRPVRASLAMVAWARRTGQVHLLAEGYIATRSRHNLGLAVDVTLRDLVTGVDLPMGTAFDTFSEEAHTANAAGRIRTYRQILVRAMEAEGFRNYEKEWWHFSLEVPDPVAFDVVVK
jgi:zinc D-Ala-D-Ala dipeptidase